MDSIAKTLLCIGLMAIGAATWVLTERLHIIRPMCTVSQDIWEQAK